LVIDDFGHHPTAIRETIQALLKKYPGRRLIACFEPRSNTTTRAFFQKELVECFEGASAVAIGALDRPWRYSESERLDTFKIIDELGRPGFAISVDQGKEPDWGKYMLKWLESQIEEGDLLVTFSNGDFGELRKMLN
jgi:UDP-N-acetylmuramate: L-alanyl-gamma-D-glutamyl-meso-diaminopimelate ligase